MRQGERGVRRSRDYVYRQHRRNLRRAIRGLLEGQPPRFEQIRISWGTIEKNAKFITCSAGKISPAKKNTGKGSEKRDSQGSKLCSQVPEMQRLNIPAIRMQAKKTMRYMLVNMLGCR